ncbi:hypothetical protein SAMN02799630_01236 [Paenibacillus sp. UNCCL117]|uniref:hypothetical protein n=1 Tax=unclassified Paenibacillus TaxID=185978 RepID=UPI00087FF55E|nr:MULTISPECIES: hypothetical protein [unclassified Paenibacillus]SDC70507.1 hypothetical protein SAMN04488602_103214 [Paenibacillus sp. cl123]SFW24217.1 hypothetical protein SAMN02799630_01236 [Paenibacillus sp. UNCCL117]
MTELISGEALNRLKLVEEQLQAIQPEMLRINNQGLADQQKLRLLEETQKRHEDDIRQLKETTRVIEIQFSQIMTRFDTLEMKLFSLLQQSQTASVDERKNSQKEWMTFLKYVLGGTILLIVYQLFSKGG